MAGRVTRLLIEEMARHLPPSAAALRLLDVGGAAGDVLSALRPDVEVLMGTPDALSPNTVDAVVVYGTPLADDALQAALAALRPGGRLIMTDPDGEPAAARVDVLEAAGYARILVAPGAECPAPVGVLMRGEKPHTTADTVERIEGVAAQDDDSSDLAAFRGRYLHVLVRQTPNKPVWALQPGEPVEWQGIAVQDGDGQAALLVFSSLPRAVAFMQPAVLAGTLRDVNRVAKFRREAAAHWTLPVLLNQSPALLDSYTVTLVPLDPASAEAGGE